MRFANLFFKGLLDLLYPELCFACQSRHPMPGSTVCVHCNYHIVPTDYHLQDQNPLLDKFWGRVPLRHASAFFNFSKGGLLQSLIHQLKYGNRPEIGVELGKLYGYRLKESPHYQDVDMVLPVPLHPKKEHQRGYNQAACFAQGLAEGLDCEWSREALIRQTFTESQTKKSREERFQNVNKVFAVTQPHRLADRRLLLVDDVITTGATLEACALELLQVHGVELSLAAIALANN